jgi:prevent-host-death family protein
MSLWQLQEAKGKFSELVKRARQEGPQDITLRGEPVAVLLSREDYLRLAQPKPGLVAFLRQSPLAGTEVEFSREQTPAREIAL